MGERHLRYRDWAQVAYLPAANLKSDKKALLKLSQQVQSLEIAHPLDAVPREHLTRLLEEGDEGMAQYYLFLAQSPVAGENTTQGIVPHPQSGNFISFVAALSHPLSTGSVHSTSSDPSVPPSIDNRYLSNPVDLKLHVRHVRYFEKIAQTQPIASFLKEGGRRNDPLAFIDGSLEKAKDYVKATSTTNWHFVGTAAMAPKENGGIVDARLKVYGMEGLRWWTQACFRWSRKAIRSPSYMLLPNGLRN